MDPIVSRVARMTSFATVAVLASGELLAQGNSVARPISTGVVTYRDPETIVPEPKFEAGGLHRLLFGNTWRTLWLRPVPVRVLDLSRTAGGVEAVAREKGGSRAFELVASDSRTFGFRELVKDATRDWPEEHRTHTLRKLAQDQISGTVPGGALAVAVIERAVGSPSVPVQLVALPDDQRLREWKEEFAGKSGILEPRLRQSDEWLEHVRAEELLSSAELFTRLRADPASQPDARAFLTTRLVDLLVGDWDRHEGQWTWAAVRRGAEHHWVPIASDRDWAFNHLDGLAWGLVRKAQPKFQRFDARISGLGGLLLRAQGLDRRLLASLDRAAWDSVTGRVVSRVTDGVIARAIAALPAGLDSGALGRLEATLKARRDELPAASAAFYRSLAEVVEVWATDGPDRLRIEERPDGAVRLTVERGSGKGARWSRTFVPAETREVRVYLLTGEDQVVGSTGASPVKIRVIHEGGGALKLPSDAGIRVYDSTATFTSPARPFHPEEMFRDWGGSLGFAPWLNQRSGVGFLLGGGPVLTRYGFRRDPYAYRIALRAAYTTGTKAFNLDLKSDFRLPRQGTGIRMDGRALWGDAIHYFGVGNETARTEPSEFYLLWQQAFEANPRYYIELGKRGIVSIGPVASHTESNQTRPTLALAERPYGFGSFTAVGGHAGAELDLRNDPVYPLRGIRVQVNGRYFPAMADVREPFAVVRGELAGYLGTSALPGSPVLAIRGGGAKGWGELPFFEAPALGGKHTLRGFSRERFLGNSMLYGGAELRLRFGWFKLMLPGEWGIYGLGDIGRVYLEGETSTLWHKTWGGGLWLSFFDRRTPISFTWASSPDGGKFYLSGGFHF